MKEREAISESTTSNGYIRVTFRGGAQEYKHRMVMEEVLGRKLDRYECVHHINGNKSDNSRENLELMPLKDHARMHMLDSPERDRLGRVLTCRICGKPRYYSPYQLSYVKKQGEYRCQPCFYGTARRAQDMGHAIEGPR